MKRDIIRDLATNVLDGFPNAPADKRPGLMYSAAKTLATFVLVGPAKPRKAPRKVKT